jgi:hypothetical protein
MRALLFLLTLLTAMVSCASARAGTYDVYSCRLPNGSPAPTNGWTPFATPIPEVIVRTSDACGSGGGLIASIPLLPPTGVDAGWRFTAPAGTTIEAFELSRTVRPAIDPQGETGGYLSSLGDWPPTDIDHGLDERCLTGLLAAPYCNNGVGLPGSTVDESARYARAGLHARRLTLGVGCWASGLPGNPLCGGVFDANPNLAILAAKLTLRDDSAPAVQADLIGGSTVRDEVAANAGDEGSGLTATSLVVDGVDLGRQPVRDLPASCHEPFVDPMPCPSQRDLSIPLDPRAVADGVHVMQVAAIDAAGNRGLSAPVSVRVANRGGVSPLVPGPNGGNATRFTRLRAWFAGRSRKAVRTLAYGATTSVEGQLTTTDGAPIGGATLQVEQRDIGIMSRPTRVAAVTTDAKGRFTYRVARGASRSFRFLYTAFPGDAGPVASAQVSVHVRAGVSLKASPARVHNGTVLTFRGRVLGERGSRRAVVTIYALSRGGPRPRIPVETVRAAASGMFTYRYRFSSIPGPVTYKFEARVLKQTGFPYVEGASRPVSVRGRP